MKDFTLLCVPLTLRKQLTFRSDPIWIPVEIIGDLVYRQEHCFYGNESCGKGLRVTYS
jgi:hypothetical protein